MFCSKWVADMAPYLQWTVVSARSSIAGARAEKDRVCGADIQPARLEGVKNEVYSEGTHLMVRLELLLLTP